ncbi:hypothetical protein QBC44DRAFT_330933 [Cladorrhinum sp. PSN332]|nr:hypothetical protein QBC44DRAFT_330933 [Cladorrhinum sp. PSN332]
MDDIWGSDNEDHSNNHHYHHYTTTTTTSNHHPSDIPRLQQEHTTAGYRDGITFAKSQHVQAGFDEGYGLGATIGARAGQLLGLLEGLAAAIGLHSLSCPPSPPRAQETRRIEALLNEARKELSVQSVFGKEYWGEDGTWRYEVVGGREEGEREEEEEEDDDHEVVFGDVAGAHPLLRKWDGIVKSEAAGYGVDWDVLKDGERDLISGEEDSAVAVGKGSKGKQQREVKKGSGGGGEGERKSVSEAFAW